MNKLAWLKFHAEDTLDYLGSLTDNLRVPYEQGLAHLRRRHVGQTCYIIGKGPSLQHLTCGYIGKGPIITINSALLAIEHLKPNNTVYAMMKDGGDLRKYKINHWNQHSIRRPGCDFTEACGDRCGGIIRPKSATLLVHKNESYHCFNDYNPRYIFTLNDLGFKNNMCSAVCAIAIAHLMGCYEIAMVAFDSITTGDSREFIPGEGIREAQDYEQAHKYIRAGLSGIKHRWVTPC